MRIGYKTYFILSLVLLLSSCELPIRRISYAEDVVATVGVTALTRDEVESSMPKYLVGEDSLDFVNKYVDRWVKRQVKVDEADRIFSSSVHEVELMVKAYRQTLMTQRLDRYYINSSGAPEIDEAQIRSYYNKHSDIFRLDRNIVKGRILRLPLSHSSESKMKSMMNSSSKDSRLNLISISEKNQELELEEFTDQWIDFDDFLGKLPIVRDNKSKAYLTRDGVQRLQDSEWCYLFEVTGYRREGYVAPLEIVEDRIRQILTSDLQTQMIREKEEQLYEQARQQGKINVNKSDENDDKRD